MGEPQPLILVPNAAEFLFPETSDGIIRLENSQEIELHCSVGFTIPALQPATSIFPVCVTGNQFLVNQAIYNFTDFTCTQYPRHVARRTGRLCHGNAIEITIGFPVGSRFIEVMDVCHDEATATNLYVHFEQKPRNEGFQRSFPRPGWLMGGFYPGISVDQAYSRIQQRDTIAQILGSTELAEQIIHPTNNLFLARGHLAARVDVIFGIKQRATFYFINAAPQFQTFNAGNWESVESHVRRWVDNQNIDIEIYTGTHGIVTFPDINGIQREIFLNFDENGNGRIPVPKIYYKVLYEPSTASGIVIIGVNNPYATIEEIERDYIFCEDISDRIDWINWQRDDIVSGYSYACSVSEFSRVVGHLPNLNVVNLLY